MPGRSWVTENAHMIIAMIMLMAGVYLLTKDTSCGGAIDFQISTAKGLSLSSPTAGGVLWAGALAIVIIALFRKRTQQSRIRIREREGPFGRSFSADIRGIDDQR
jgi:hypothetical protein